MIFTTFFAVAMAMGHLTSRLRLKEVAERNRERRTAALYELVQQAGLAPDLDSGLQRGDQTHRDALRRACRSRYCDARIDTLADRSASGQLLFSSSTKEYGGGGVGFQPCAAPAGKFTDNLPDAEAMHLPLLQARAAAMGVLSMLSLLPRQFLTYAERELLEAFAVLIGTILEKERSVTGR